MKLIRMTASFGRLDRETLELGPGLNIVEAPNEGGKSTWAAFLKVMLYGLDTKSRDRKGFLADKNRYRPWSGAPMEGVLECEWRGRRLTLRRWTKGAALMGAFSAVWTDTGESVEGMTGDNAGELLVGVGRETFERSAFLRQTGLAVDQSPELEKRIAALVSSGEEDVSFSAAQDRLKSWLRKRQYRASGQIPRLEAEREEIDALLAQMEQVNRRVLTARAELEELTLRQRELEGERELHRRLKRHRLNQAYAQAREALDQARREEETLKTELSRFGPIPARERLRQAQEELAYLRTAEENWKQAQRQLAQEEERVRTLREAAERAGLDGGEPEELQARAMRDAERCRKAARPAAGAAVLTAAGAILLALALANGAMGWWGEGPVRWLAALPPAALLVWQGSVLLRRRRERAACAALLEQYGAADPDGILDRAAEWREQWAGVRQAEAVRDQTAQAAEDWKARLDQGKLSLFGFVYTFAPEVNTLIGVSAAISRALGLEDKLSTAALKRQNAQEKADFLAAQGGQSADTLELLHEPERSEEETAAQLEAVNGELSRVRNELAMAQGEQRATGDPAELEARRSGIGERLAALRLDCRGLEMALDSLEAANSQLQARFSPELNRRAGALMARLTGGKYEKVTLDRTLDAAAEERGGLVPRPVLSLSQGTADQLYLAVRLAICSLVLPEEDPCPLVLDDALANFDDGRLTLALDLLRELAKERQILLLTCHGRERARLAGAEEVRVQRLGGESA